jgi:xylulokinase
MNVLAIDVGTSSVKAAVVDTRTGAVVGAVAHAAITLDAPSPDASELPCERLWQALAAAGRAAVVRSGVSGKADEEIGGVGLSCFTPALVLLNKNDRPIRPILTHLDRRARPAARQVWATVGPEFLATVGNRPLPGGISAVTFRQLFSVDPYILHEVRSYLHLNGWLGFHMTGEKAFDPANASFTGLFGTLTDQQWSQRWCDYFEVDRAWLPPVMDGSATLGSIRSDVAGELGVPAGVPCKLGSADTTSAMLAAGLKVGELLHEVGTTQVLAALTDKPVPAPQRMTRLFGIGKSFVHVTHNPVGGVALDWLHLLCFRDQTAEEFFASTIPQALKRTTRITLDPPFLGGDRLEIEAHRAAFRDLELSTDRMDLLAALLQAMVRGHGEALADLGMGTTFRRIVLSGGGERMVRQLLPEYQAGHVEEIEEASLRGVAKLFQETIVKDDQD